MSVITCTIEGCHRVFKNSRSFQVHVKKKHPTFWARYGRSGQNVEDFDNIDELNSGSDRSDSDNEHENIENEQVEDHIDTDFKSTQFLLGLREKYKVNDQTCSYVAEEVQGVLQLAREQLHKQTQDAMPQAQRAELNEIFRQSQMEQSFSYFRNTSHMNSYAKVNFDFIEPVEYVLGRNRNGKVKSFQYVSIIQTLQALLKRDEVFAYVIQEHQNNGVIEDFCDGSIYKNHTLFSQPNPTIQIQLYNDDFTVANPIGNKVKQLKFSAFYLVLGNIEPKFRSQLSTIQLALICPSAIVHEYGMSQVMAPLIHDLKHLESVGINIDRDGHMYNFRGTLSMVVADNLAAHGIGGFQESFNTDRLCRFCMVTKNDVKNHFRDTDLVPRSKDAFNEQVEMAEQMPNVARIYGVKRDSPLNQLDHYHVIDGLPSDIAHDLFEGVIPYVMENVIVYCVTEGFFNLQFLNEQIENFPYSGTDKTNKPSKVAVTNLGSFKVKQKAVQCWCFLRLLPLMVGSKVPKDNRVWAVLLSLQDVVQVSTAHQVDSALCNFLADLIETFLINYTTEFPDNSMKPKFHYIIHYPKLLMKFGPLVHCWTLRFEGKHLYFKELSHHTKNRRNLCKTLAMRHEYYQAWWRSATSAIFVKDAIEHTCGRHLPVRLLLRHIQALLLPLNGGNEYVYSAKKVQWDGTWYCEGWAVATGVTLEGFIQFAVIEMCCLINGEVYLVCQKPENIRYLTHIHGYEFTLTNEFVVKRVSDLIDYYSLGVYQSNEGWIVIPRHHINKPEW